MSHETSFDHEDRSGATGMVLNTAAQRNKSSFEQQALE
jgi:hypothetical protein